MASPCVSLDEVNGGAESPDGMFELSAGFDDDFMHAAFWASGWGPTEVGTAEAQLQLPYWDDAGEQPEHHETLMRFHTEPCAEFHGQARYCSLHRPKGKASQCFCYHFESQRRRPPVDAITGQIQYWDVPCRSLQGSTCPNGDTCPFAHTRDEISYHPAKYKTRRCNGRGCRGDICCFAHSECERSFALNRYSYWVLAGKMEAEWLAVMGLGGGVVPRGVGAGVADEWQRSLGPTRVPLPATRHKQRFCASFPDVSQCRRGAICAFAHSREEARTPLLSLEQEQQAPEALTERFFMYQFKTLWCPIGVQHDWQTCVYAHNYQDARRSVSIGYGPRPCPYWAKKDPNAEYAQRCPLGLRCPYSHGAKEQLYHPQYFRTVICRDLRAKECPRKRLCAFFHKRAEKRKPPADATDYEAPLKEDVLPQAWISDFLSPPFRDAATTGSGNSTDSMLGDADAATSEMNAMGLEQDQNRYGRMLDHGDFVGYNIQELELGTLHEEVDADDKECTPRTRTDSAGSGTQELVSQRTPGAGSCFVGRGTRQGLGIHPGEAISEASSYGPFEGPFDNFPGFLANTIGEASASPWQLDIGKMAEMVS